MKKIFFAILLMVLIIFCIRSIIFERLTILDLQKKIQNCGVKIAGITADIEGYVYGADNNKYLTESIDSQIKDLRGDIKRFNTGVQQPLSFKIIPTGKENEFYLSVRLSQQSNIKNINNYIGRIMKIFKDFSGIPYIYVGFDGILNKKMSKVQMKNKACEILISCGCKNVNEIEDGDIISVTGWTPLIVKSININGVKENLNIALRCNDGENRTELWAFSPLIQKEY